MEYRQAHHARDSLSSWGGPERMTYSSQEFVLSPSVEQKADANSSPEHRPTEQGNDPEGLPH